MGAQPKYSLPNQTRKINDPIPFIAHEAVYCATCPSNVGKILSGYRFLEIHDLHFCVPCGEYVIAQRHPKYRQAQDTNRCITCGKDTGSIYLNYCTPEHQKEEAVAV